MSERKRVQLTMNREKLEKLEESARSYGISTNAFMVFILGQWVDANYSMQKVMVENVENMFSNPDELLSNPHLLEMVKEILKEDDEFKEAARKKMIKE